jgi:hypothetical protein
MLAGVEGELRDWDWKLAIGRAESYSANVESGWAAAVTKRD